MTNSDSLFGGFLLYLVLQRLAELFIAKRNEAGLRSKGGIEYARGHYSAIVILHSLFFLSCLIEFLASDRILPSYYFIFLIVLVIGQLLRFWVLLTLRDRWTTRIIVLPGEKLVRSGPYRFIAHPNYMAVVLELFAFPMIFDLRWTAIVFTILNALLLGFVRIPQENTALKIASSATRSSSSVV